MRARSFVLPWLCASLFAVGCHEKIAVSSPIDASFAPFSPDGAAANGVARAADAGGADAGARAAGPRHPLGGRIYDLAGFPVAGASVSVRDAKTRTAAEGTYSLRVPADASHLEVEAPGYRAARVTLRLGDSLARADALLVATGTIGGAVIDELGRGVAGARVALAGSAVWPARQTTTDPAGRYALDDVAEGVYELVAVREGGVPLASPRLFGVAIEGPGGAATADLRMVRAGFVRGRAIGPDGRAVAGARVTLREERLSILGDDAFTDALGAFRSGYLAPGRYVVRVLASGMPAPPLAEVLVAAGETTYHLTLPRGATLRGRVTDASGAGVAGARLVARVEGHSGPSTVAPRSRRHRERLAQVRSTAFRGLGGSAAGPGYDDETNGGAVTDKGGRFTLQGVPAGSVTVLAFHADHGPARSPPHELKDGETRELVLTLTVPATLEGRVVDELGSSMDGARVVLRDPRGVWERRVIRAGEGGRFRVRGLPPGPLLVSASEAEHLPQELRVTLEAEKSFAVELKLWRGQTLVEGLCTNAEGAPVPGARVTLTSMTMPIAPRVATSDEVGHFKFESLPSGNYVVLAESRGSMPVTLRDVDGSDALEIRFFAAGGIAGKVVDARGDPLAGIEVRVEEESGATGGMNPVALTDGVGVFRVQPLAPGSYRVLAMAPGIAGVEVKEDGVVVREGEAADPGSLTLVLNADTRDGGESTGELR